MPLRIAFDLDGVLADFSAAYDRVADRLFPESRLPAPARTSAAGVETAPGGGDGGRPGGASAEAVVAAVAPARRGRGG